MLLYNAASTPTGAATSTPIPTVMADPTIAVAIPPPGTPTGVGSAVRNCSDIAGNPWRAT